MTMKNFEKIIKKAADEYGLGYELSYEKLLTDFMASAERYSLDPNKGEITPYYHESKETGEVIRNNYFL